MPSDLRTAALPAIVRGEGRDLILVPGFGLAPWTYEDAVKLLSRRVRVIVPNWLRTSGRWDRDRVVAELSATLDDLGADRPAIVGHSFGGALALGAVAREPHRYRAYVTTDSAALESTWRLTKRTLPPGSYVYRLATYQAAVGFGRGGLRHPAALVRAGAWAVRHDPTQEIQTVRAADVPCHVLWAERDTLLPKDDGRMFAEELGGTFSVIRDPVGPGPVDHDWVYRHPHLLEDVLDELGLL